MVLSETQARENLKILLADFDKLSADDRKAMSEASVVRQFIDRLLRDVLGWPIEDPQRYKYEMHTQAGRPDLTLFPEKGGVIFVEAKRFGIIKELEQARYTIQGVITPGQMALPGMAVDRTQEEQQAINYAFANGGEWAILTNFERLRLFNARRDWLVLSFERPHAYLTEFDQLWQLSYENVLSGSLDALSNQRYARDIDTQYLDFVNEWRLRLAQDVVRRRGLNRWAFNRDGTIRLNDLRSVVQRFLDRLVITRFAEDWLVIPPATLRQFADMRRGSIYTHSMDGFLDQFFRRFDKEHNSALFAFDRSDEAIFSDDVLLALVEKLYEVRYRAMPADILGNTYEQFLGKTLALSNGSVTTRDNLETRKKQGSYYTPQVIVQYIVDHSLGRYLYGTENGKPDGKPLNGELDNRGTVGSGHGTVGSDTHGTRGLNPLSGQPISGESRKTSFDMHDLKVLDSACGSGSFLIYAYQVLAAFYEGELGRLKDDYDARVRDMAANFDKISLDDRIAAERVQQEQERIRNYPRLILETHLYGVDLDPQAAEIATVNLMMRAMEGRHREKRLPLVLGQNVKVGNGLVGLRPDDDRMTDYQAVLAELIAARELLMTDPDKDKEEPEIRQNQFYDMTEEEARRIPNFKLIPEALDYIRRRDSGELVEPPVDDPTHETFRGVQQQTRAAAEPLDALLETHFSDLSRVRPFHWGIEFPEVFYKADGTLKDNPGFTVIFGNPPWEILKPDLREFYAQFDERIESKFTRTQVEARIAELEAEDPRRKDEFALQTQVVEHLAAYTRQSTDFTRQGRGDTATHKLFLERMWSLLQSSAPTPPRHATDNPSYLTPPRHAMARGLGGEDVSAGRLGYVVPSGLYTDLGTKDLREMLLDEGNIQYIFSFSNERFFFPGVDHRFKFAMLGAQKGAQSEGFTAAFRFNPRDAVAPDELPAFLGNPDNLIYVRRESLKRFSPDSLSVMEFQSREDYEIAEKIYNGWPLLGDTLAPPRHAMERGLGGEDASLASGLGGEDVSPPYAPTYTDTELWDKLKPLARQMRHDPTPAEEALWQRLRNRAVRDAKFRRQHPVDRFIVDFYCAEAHLVVEVDGEIHDYTPDEDALRQAYLESLGLRVIRFPNEAVLGDMETVIERIAEVVGSPHPPAPSPLHGEGEQDAAMWNVKFTREFDITNDRHLFNTQGNGLPLYEGKMIHQYDAFYAEPQFWISEDKLSDLSDNLREEIKTYRVVHRRIAATTNERTLISAIVPVNTACENNATTILIEGSDDQRLKLFVCALLNSYPLDYLLRYKVATTLNMFYMQTLPLPRLTAGNPYFDAIVERAARLTCTRPEFAALWQSVMGTLWTPPRHAMARGLGGEDVSLRNEVDALVARLYGLTHDEFDHILGTFPLVFPDTDAGRAKRAALLDVFDQTSV